MISSVSILKDINDRAPHGRDLHGVKDLLSSVAVIDILLVLGSLFSLPDYGGALFGLSDGQVTALRMAVSGVCFLVVLHGVKISSLPPLYKVVFAYSCLVVIEGALSEVNPGAAVVEGLCCALFFLLPYRLSNRYGKKMGSALLFWPLFLVVLITDCYVFASGGAGSVTVYSEYSVTSNYLLGNKFMVAYLNMLCFAMLYQKFPSILTVIVAGMASVLISSLVQCSTGITGSLLMTIVMACLSMGKISRVPGSLLPILTVLMAFIAVGFTGLLTWGPIGDFVTNFLGESSDLTGRTYIYPVLVDLFAARPLLGYGSSGAAGMAVMDLIGAANAQEGLFHILLSNGLIGALLFLVIQYMALRGLSKSGKDSYGLLAFLLAMVLLSSIEINLGVVFMFGLGLISPLMPTPPFEGSTGDARYEYKKY